MFNVAAICRKSPREQLSQLDYYSVPGGARAGAVKVISGVPRPRGVTALSIFFAFGIIPSTASALALAFPGSWADALWRLKPEAPAQFVRLGAVAIPLMIGVALACAGAAVGLWTRQRWGHRLAIGVLSVNLLGDTLNAVLRGDWRTVVGLPIGGLMLVYLFSDRVRAWFGRPFSGETLRRRGPSAL